MSPASRPPRRGGRPANAQGREVIFEFTPVDAQVRVAAVDVRSGTEVVVFGPANTLRSDLERLALNKLRYVMGARREEPAPEPPARPGKLV